MLRWKLLFPWVEFDSAEKDIYCKECREANLKNAYAVGKARPLGGWKKEYLQRHSISSDHVKLTSMCKTQTRLIDDDRLAVRVNATERETTGLISNVLFLLQNSLSLSKATPLHSHVDSQLLLFSSDDKPPNSPMSPHHRSSYSTWEFVHSTMEIFILF